MLRKLTLNKTDLTVSQLCLGSNMFGTAQPAEKANELLDAFCAAGGNFIDTAHSYGDWIPDAPSSASERTLGKWLQGKTRSDHVIATKGCEFDHRAGDYALRVTPAHLERDLHGSLDRLNTSYIDLYWLHRDDPSCPVQDLIDALITHQQAGRIRYFGCSNWSVARIKEAQAYAASIGHTGFVACQPMWGLAEPDRQAMISYSPGNYYEDGYRELHQAGLTMIPYSGQSRGVFSKLNEGGAAALGADVAALFLSDRNLNKLVAINMVAQRHHATINDVVLSYLTSQPYLTIPIIGCSSVEQLHASIAACDLKLTEAELEELRLA